MKRFPILGVILLVPALVLLVVTGCSKDAGTPKGGGKDKGSAAADKGSKGGQPKTKITAATDGTVVGVVMFDGKFPAPVLEEDIIKKHSDAKFCMTGKAKDIFNVAQQTWIGKDGGVGNVVIALEPGDGKEYDIKSELKDKWKKHDAVADQPYCQYVPHVVPVFAGVQKVVFKNSAKVSHNVNVKGGVINGDTDKLMAANTAYDRGSFKFSRDPILVSCSQHTWMNAKIITVKHPYFAVTKEDGSFEIHDVPVGEELRVMMWHESAPEWKDAGKVTAKKGEKTKLELKISK